MRRKLYIGPRMRLLREQQGLTLSGCAERLGLSPSYLSQVETNRRPVTAGVLIALSKAFQVDPADFDLDDEYRLIADLREASADTSLGVSLPSIPELKLAAATTPTLARQFLALHAAYRSLDDRVKVLDETLGPSDPGLPAVPLPYEEVRDFFHYRDNYLDELDVAAEVLAHDIGVRADSGAASRIEVALQDAHGVTVATAPTGDVGMIRRFDKDHGTLWLATGLSESTRAFQLAAQIANLGLKETIRAVLSGAGFKSKASEAVARVALENYAAGALLMPYTDFAANALSLRHDVEQLQLSYRVSFEQVCHRLSTLQRPGARGIPFYFVRVDQAGNITKRHSSTRFQFARFGGACPLWNVHEAFAHPGRILVQVAQMPDSVRYLCVGHSVVKRSGSYLRPNRHYSLGLGCEIRHARDVVYADGLALNAPAVPIGNSCRICERTNCQQRAFPPIDRKLTVPADERRVIPYQIE